MTDTIGVRLLEAILAVQAEAPTLLKEKKATVKSDKGSYTYTYIGLDSIVEKIGPILAKHGLVWMAFPVRDEHGPALRYELVHAKTGETRVGTMPLLLTKTDPQGMGSAITYARRYSLCAVLNLVADDDDDGARAKQPQPKQERGPTVRERIYGHATGRLTGLQLLNVIRAVKGADRLEISETDAMTRLDAAISNVKPGEVDRILAKVDEYAGD